MFRKFITSKRVLGRSYHWDHARKWAIIVVNGHAIVVKRTKRY
jgi:hypothetical protein